MPVIKSEEEIIDILSVKTIGSSYKYEMYKTNFGDWYLTYGGGHVPGKIAMGVINKNLVNSKYSDCPNLCYWKGPTYDVEETLKIRKTPVQNESKSASKLRKKSVVYLNSAK